MCKKTVLNIICLKCLVLSYAWAQEQDPEPLVLQARNLEEGCLKYRRDNVTQGYLRLRVDVASSANADSSVSKSIRDMRVWFKGDNVRIDNRAAIPGNGWSEWTVMAVSGDRYIVIPGENGVAGTVGLVSEYGDAMAHFGLYNPRWLAMGVNGESQFQKDPLAMSVGMAGKLIPKQVICTGDNPQTWEIVYSDTISLSDARQIRLPQSGAGDATTPHRKSASQQQLYLPVRPGDGSSGAKINNTPLADDPVATASVPKTEIGAIENRLTAQIRPAEGFSLVKATAEHRSPGKELVLAMECEYRPIGQKLIWFPHRVRRTEHAENKPIREEIIEVIDADFDNVVRDAVFSMNGIDLPDGKKIFDRSRGPIEQPLIVADGKLVEIPPALTAVIEAGNVSQLRRLLLVLTGVVCAVLAMLCILRFTQRRPA
jgi:hypothetical protein